MCLGWRGGIFMILHLRPKHMLDLINPLSKICHPGSNIAKLIIRIKIFEIVHSIHKHIHADEL